MRTVPSLIAAAGLALSGNSVFAQDGPPVLDIEKTCSSSGRAEVQVQTSQQDGQDGCLRSERAAHDELKKRWKEFSAAAKNQCSKQSNAGGFPSYVETVTCLELATGTVPAQTNGGDTSEATSGPGAPKDASAKREGGNLTSEPSPKQRTNPIDVLEKKP